MMDAKHERGAKLTKQPLISPIPGRADNRREIESLINSLVGESRPGSTTTGGAASPAHRRSRPNSVLSTGELSNETSEYAAGGTQTNGSVSAAPSQPQVLSTVSLTTVYECPPSPVKEVFSYSKGVQTTDDLLPLPPTQSRAVYDSDGEEPTPATPNKKPSRREREREEELRKNIRREVEEELQATREKLAGKEPSQADPLSTNYPARVLSSEELEAVTSSVEFVDFLEKSTKVIEKALDLEYDILTDYTLQPHDEEDDDEQGNVGGRGRRKVKEVRQFYDEKWSRKRMITSIDFSPKFPDLMLASYTKNPSAPFEPDGIVQVWSLNLHDRPEFVFHAQSDILTARFSPFSPNLIYGGTYSGQVLVWDTRARSAPVQKTPLTGSGHTHPVYALDIVGTQNANNIISCSTDGVVCSWAENMLAQPQEFLSLTVPPPCKVDDLAVTCLAFPHTDPTFFLVGSEEGTIYPCHRYDRAGAKAGVDARVRYAGHTAPVMSVDFHPARGPVDLGDLVLSSSLDWSVKLWKVRAPAATSAIVTGSGMGVAGTAVDNTATPLLDFIREDLVYDAAWSPVKPGVFSIVDGAGWLELWDITVDLEEPVARITPSQRKDGRSMLANSLNRVAWDKHDGKRLATGGISGALTVFEVGSDLGGREGLRSEEWTNVKKLVNRLEASGINGVEDNE